MRDMSEALDKTTNARAMDDVGSFEDPEAAERTVPKPEERAAEEPNGKDITGQPLYVSQEELTHRFEQMNRHQWVNLYVKNLEDTIDDERLQKEFAPFGTIISAKVMMEEGRSKGFGFVCFSSPEEATKAVQEMNRRIIVSKPLYVALAQRKEDRKAHLASKYIQRQVGMRMQQGFQPGGPSYFVPTMPQAQSYYPQMPQVGTRQPGAQAFGMQAPAGPYAGGNPRLAPNAFRLASQQRFPVTGVHGPVSHAPAGMLVAPARPTYKHTVTVHNQPQQLAVDLQGHELLGTEEQAAKKRMLGACLFQHVRHFHAELADQIAAVLLEMDSADLAYLVEHQEIMKAKVEEVAAMLQGHQTQQAVAGPKSSKE